MQHIKAKDWQDFARTVKQQMRRARTLGFNPEILYIADFDPMSSKPRLRTGVCITGLNVRTVDNYQPGEALLTIYIFVPLRFVKSQKRRQLLQTCHDSSFLTKLSKTLGG